MSKPPARFPGIEIVDNNRYGPRWSSWSARTATRTVSDRLSYRKLEIDLRVQPHVSRGLDGRRRQPWAVRHVILVEARDDVGVRGVVDVNSDLRARPAVSEDLCHAEIEVVAAGAIERGRGIRLTVTFPDERLRPSDGNATAFVTT